VLITKGAAIGATAILANSFPETVGTKQGRRSSEKRNLDCAIAPR